MPAAGAFPGKVGRTIKESTPYWPPAAKAPGGAPNILIVLFDDVGFSAFGCYGSPIATPAIDRIAAQGLRYTGEGERRRVVRNRAAAVAADVEAGPRDQHAKHVGKLSKVTVSIGDDQTLDGEAAGRAEMGRQ